MVEDELLEREEEPPEESVQVVSHSSKTPSKNNNANVEAAKQTYNNDNKPSPSGVNPSNESKAGKAESEGKCATVDLSGIKTEIYDIKQRIINLSLAVSNSRSEIAKRLEGTGVIDLTDVRSDLSKAKDQLDTIYERFSTTDSYIDSLESATAESIKDLGNNIDIIKLYIDSINKHFDDIPTKKTIYDLWDENDGLHDLKNALNELKKETNRLISNSSDSIKQSVISDLTQQVNRLKEVVGNVVKSSVNESINAAVSAGVDSGISKGLKSSNIAKDVAAQAKNAISQEVSTLRSDVRGAKDMATESRGKVTFNSFTITYALIIIISGIFTAIGGFGDIENLALLKHTLWNVVVSMLLLAVFNILYPILSECVPFDEEEGTIFRVIYYLVVGAWSVGVTLIPSLVIIGQLL